MSIPEKDPFILDRPIGPRRRARDGLLVVLVAVALLLVLEGPSIRASGLKMDPGVQRTVVLAVGHPAGWLADRLPFDEAADGLTASLSPDDELDGAGSFASSTAQPTAATTAGGGAARAPITPEAFDPAELGIRPEPLPALRSLLVTGDSMAQPLDVALARALSEDGVRVERDVHIGTGITKTDLVDWGSLSTLQAREEPDAVVMFMGANEGFALPLPAGGSVECCGPRWAAVYATRARTMMDSYRRDGDARLYWLTLPLPRSDGRQEIARAVNAAIEVAAQPFRAHVRIVDVTELFTPGGRYRAAMPVGGRNTIVRQADGIHLNDAGARLARDLLLERLREDFARFGGG